MADVTLYGSAVSTYVRTVRMTLAEKGVPYDLKEMWVDSPELAQRHPFKKIPAFRHGDFELYEAFPIARYVDEAFPGPALQPADPKARARMTQWISVHSSYCYPTMIGRIVLERLAPKFLGRPTSEDTVKSAVPDAEHQLQVLDSAIGNGPYAGGREPNLADFFLYPVMFYLSMMPEGGALLERRSALKRWMEAMGGRKSVKETMPSLS